METDILVLIICIIILLYVYMQSDCMKKMMEGYVVKRDGNNINITPYSGQTEANPGVQTEYLIKCNNDRPRKLTLLNPMDVYTHLDGSQKMEERYKFKPYGYNNDRFPTGVFNNVEDAGMALCNM
jgi:hypothetical protein